MGSRTRSSSRSRPGKKAQFFVLSAFVMIGVMFVLSQFVQPSKIFDTSPAVLSDDVYIFNNIREKTVEVVEHSKNCEELRLNLEEYKQFVEKFVLFRNTKLGFYYLIQPGCDSDIRTTFVDLTVVSTDVSARSTFMVDHLGDPPEDCVYPCGEDPWNPEDDGGGPVPPVVPVINVISPVNGADYAASDVMAAATLSKPANYIRVQVDGGPAIDMIWNAVNMRYEYNMVGLIDGPHNVIFTAQDTDGLDATPVSVDFTVTTAVAPDLVLWLELDDNVGMTAIDSSTYGNDGVIEGTAAPLWKRIGKFGDNRLSGESGATDMIRVPNSPSLQFGADESFTVMTWVRLYEEEINENTFNLVGNEDGSVGFSLGVDAYDATPGINDNMMYSNFYFSVKDSTGISEVVSILPRAVAVSGPEVDDGSKWHHVAGVRDRTNAGDEKIMLYVDGVLIGTVADPTTGDLNPAVGDIAVGSLNDASTPLFGIMGEMDDVRIYKSVWTDAEIRTEYLRAPVGETGTILIPDEGWEGISFQSSYDDPVVVGTTNTLTDQDSMSMIFQADSVTSTTASMRLCGSDQDDGCTPHGPETAGYMVIDGWRSKSIDGVEAGTFLSGSSNLNFNRREGLIGVQFDEEFESRPVVLMSLQTAAITPLLPTGASAEPRVMSVYLSDFSGGICNPTPISIDTCDDIHPPETIGWVAIDGSMNPFEQITESGSQEGAIGGGTLYTQTYSVAFPGIPVVISEVQNSQGNQEFLVDHATSITTTGADVAFCEIDNAFVPVACDAHAATEIGWYAAENGVLLQKDVPQTDSVKASGIWHFDDNVAGKTTVFDSSGNENHGTLLDGSIYEINGGKFLSGMRIQSGSFGYAQIPHDNSLNIKSAEGLTIEAWINPEPGLSADGPIVEKQSEYNFEVNADGTISLSLEGAGVGDWAETYTSTDTITFGEWHYIAGTWDSTTGEMKLYIDGLPVSDPPAIHLTAPSSTSEPFEIGRGIEITGGPKAFDGVIDSVRMYQRALSDAEILKSFNDIN